jgi:hypothetical protein
MLAPPFDLSPVQRDLLRELDLCDLPNPETGAVSLSARGLDAGNVRDALPTLLWAGLVAQENDGGLTLTPSGAAALYAAECDELTTRLSAVASFAETVARGAPSRSAGHALRRLAEGSWTLAQAEGHVRSGNT